MCGHNLVAEQIWVFVQARSHLLAETMHRKMRYTRCQGKFLLLSLLDNMMIIYTCPSYWGIVSYVSEPWVYGDGQSAVATFSTLKMSM